MTAAAVPSCVTAVNAAPGSSQPRSAGTIRRWPLEEMGRNSVRPWTMPRTTAWRRFTERERVVALDERALTPRSGDLPPARRAPARGLLLRRLLQPHQDAPGGGGPPPARGHAGLP